MINNYCFFFHIVLLFMQKLCTVIPVRIVQRCIGSVMDSCYYIYKMFYHNNNHVLSNAEFDAMNHREMFETVELF